MAFENIIGQDIALRPLKDIIKTGGLRGSYLFLGPVGIGKYTTAIEVAKALNCEERKLEAHCDCLSCNKISSMKHPDVFSIAPEGASGSIKIGKIRDIIYQASLKPYEGKKKLFIIDYAEKMTEEAQNSLLKILEEPPRDHILILIASNLSGLLPTVLSRCKVFKFSCLTEGQIRGFLKSRNLKEEKAALFSHMAMGSLGRAIRFEEKDMVSYRDKIINDFFFKKTALLKEDVLNKASYEDIEESLYMLLCWYRDLLVSKFTDTREALLNIDRCEEIFSYAGNFSKEKLRRALSDIITTIEYIRKNVNPKVALFNMALQLKRQ